MDKAGHSAPRAPAACPRSQARLGLVRSWQAAEAWLGPMEFARMLHAQPYETLLECESWQVGAYSSAAHPGAGIE